MTVLKIDRDARRDDRRAELAKMLRDAVWGDSSTPITHKRLIAALVIRHAALDAMDPLNDAIDTAMEAASLRLIRKVGARWVPSPDVQKSNGSSS